MTINPFHSYGCSHNYSKTCVKRPLSKRPTNDFKTNYCLMQVKSIIREHSAILSTFVKLPVAIKVLFCLFSSGRFTQVLLKYGIVYFVGL